MQSLRTSPKTKRNKMSVNLTNLSPYLAPTRLAKPSIFNVPITFVLIVCHEIQRTYEKNC
ncbi:hypothetical protein Mapa_010336 [Marchantia paleacea]|nr:hypothetical protein Mapa_010336 [Marchantia paleacea]